MPPTIADLIRALPEETETALEIQAPALLPVPSLRAVPIGRWRRLRLIGSLQAKITAAYLFYWVRGWFQNADQKQRDLAETHWRTALRVLDALGYLRGAVMKVGQTLASYPDVAPTEFVETLQKLHFEAPPMHWSLLREMVSSELEDDPEKIFASFETCAFAAASLGQVHRATLHCGQEVAVKIQYPGIARSVREDFRNFFLLLLPGRLGSDWENMKDQFDDLRTRLERETDYEAEARTLAHVRPLFRDDEGIVVPRVYREYSTGRVLTMERLQGLHLRGFLARGPSQEERNEFARKMIRAWYRMFYSGRLMYADIHPGNFLFMDDGRLGVIDFGFVLPLGDELWSMMRDLEPAMCSGRPEELASAVKKWNGISDAPEDAEFLRLCIEFAAWAWRSRSYDGEYDLGDEADFRRGFDLFSTMVSKRYSRAHPSTPAICRQQFGWRAILYQLKARVDVKSIADEEVKATGWGRDGNR